MIYAANTDEAGFTDLANNPYYQQVKAIADAEGSQVLPICAKMEQDIAELEGDEKLMFLRSWGWRSPAWTGSSSAPTHCWASSPS